MPCLKILQHGFQLVAGFLWRHDQDLADQPLWSETRGHDSDFASEALVTFYDPAADYAEASVRSRKVEAATERQLVRDLPAAIPEETALAAAEGWLRDNRLARRTLQLALGPGEVAVEPGDVLRFPALRFKPVNARCYASAPATLREVQSSASPRWRR